MTRRADTLPARSCTCPPGACTRSECVSCRRLAPGEDCHGMAAAAAAMRSVAGIKAEPAPARDCPDCGGRASGNVPNVHARHCRHHAITELRNSVAVAVARNGLADYGQPGPRDYPYLCGLLSDALARVLAEIDAWAGA